jgi:hypothetical protein
MISMAAAYAGHAETEFSRHLGREMDAHTASREETPVSHHLDTPLAAQTGQLYLGDLHVFPAVPSGLRPSVAAAQRTRDFPYVVPA